MEVHHRAYWNELLPWEYPDKMLVTLCNECHEYIHKNKETDIAKIGDILNYYHSDWCMTCIVYDVNVLTKTAMLLGVDDGGGCDSIYEELLSFKELYGCRKVESVRECNYLFVGWWKYIYNHLEETPFAFRYNFEEIMSSNQLLRDIAENPDKYIDNYYEEDM